MLNKPAICLGCPLHEHTYGFVPLQEVRGAKTLIVGEAPGSDEADAGVPFVGGSGSFLNNLLRKAGIERSTCSVTNTICCRPPNNIYPTDNKWHYTSRSDARAGVAYCAKHFLQPAIERLAPTKIFAVGEQALQATTQRKGILVWRGSALPSKWDNSRCSVMPTLHPAYLLRDMKYTSAVIGDLRKSLQPAPEYYNLHATTNDLRAWNGQRLAFDFEWDYNGDITICGLTDRSYHCTVGSWYADNLEEYRRIFESATDLIGHNIIGADTTFFEKLDWHVAARMHDTMLKQHLVQPDFRHSLAFCASVFTNKPFWKGRGKEQEDDNGNIIDAKTQWKTWNQPDGIPRELGGYAGCRSADEAYRLYNARDTDASYQLNEALDTLLQRYGLEEVYWNVSLPIAYVVRDISDHGIRIDPTRVKEIRQDLAEEIEELELTLPEGLAPEFKPIIRQVPASPGTYNPGTKRCKGAKKLGTAHDPTVITFYRPNEIGECPVCRSPISAPKLREIKRVKVSGTKKVVPWNSSPRVKAYAKSLKLREHINRKSGASAADKLARKGWGREHPEFKIIDRLKVLSTERNNFAKQEMEEIDRLYFNLLVHGTSEGRFSSSGKREGIDPNIQNQPKSIRKIYIPDRPDHCFIELDYSGGENWLTSWIAQDLDRLARLGQPGYSEHLALAKRYFKLPEATTKAQAMDWDGKDLYDIGKHANHGLNYGMTHIKFREYCEGEGYFFSEKECKAFIAEAKALNPRTAAWQAETIERAKRDGFLRNAFNRMRWFSTRDIATKSLAFLPASTLADVIIRAMIAHYPERFSKELQALRVQRAASLLPGWFINIQVHDSLVLQGPYSTWQEQAARTKELMTQAWEALDGFALSVGIKAGEAGVSWGELKEVNV